MTQYARGTAFERKIKRQYEERGWLVVRSAGSKGPFDLVAAKKGWVRFIQCKLRKPTKREREAAIAARDKYGLSIVYLVWPDGDELLK